MTPYCVPQLNSLRYTNLLELDIKRTNWGVTWNLYILFMCNRKTILAWSHHIWTWFHWPKMFLHLHSITFFGQALYGWAQCFGSIHVHFFHVHIYSFLSASPSFGPICALQVDSQLKCCFFASACWESVTRVLIVKCHLKFKGHANTHTHLCLPLNLHNYCNVLYLISKSRCRLKIRRNVL